MKVVEIIQAPHAPLYHGTDLLSLASIIRDDSVSEGAYWNRVGEPHGVRLTRDPRVAWNYGDADIPEHGVLAFDQTKIRQRYRIVPYRDVDMHGDRWSLNEMEEVVLTPKMPISPFLVQIILDPNQLKALRVPELSDYALDHGLFKSRRAYYAGLDMLLRHPLLKPTRRG